MVERYFRNVRQRHSRLLSDLTSVIKHRKTQELCTRFLNHDSCAPLHTTLHQHHWFVFWLLVPNARDHLFGRSGDHWAMMVRRHTLMQLRPVLSTFIVLAYTQNSCFQCLSHLPHETLVPTGATLGLPPILINSSLYDDVVYVCIWVSLSYRPVLTLSL